MNENDEARILKNIITTAAVVSPMHVSYSLRRIDYMTQQRTQKDLDYRVIPTDNYMHMRRLSTDDPGSPSAAKILHLAERGL